MKETVLGWSCNTHRREKIFTKNVAGKIQVGKTLESPRKRWQYVSKTYEMRL
jgi:hypothetical protein